MCGVGWCVCVCLCVCVFVSISTHEHRKMLGILSFCMFYSFENLRLAVFFFFKLGVSQRVPRIHLCLPLAMGSHACRATPCVLTRVIGIQTQVLMPAWQPFLLTEPSPQPQVLRIIFFCRVSVETFIFNVIRMNRGEFFNMILK